MDFSWITVGPSTWIIFEAAISSSISTSWIISELWLYWDVSGFGSKTGIQIKNLLACPNDASVFQMWYTSKFQTIFCQQQWCRVCVLCNLSRLTRLPTLLKVCHDSKQEPSRDTANRTTNALSVDRDAVRSYLQTRRRFCHSYEIRRPTDSPTYIYMHCLL